jgi:hypothetical protein
MNLEEFEKKVIISRAAAGLFIRDKEKFTIKNIAKEAVVKIVEIYQLFDDKDEILIFFYDSVVPLYKMMISEIDDFDSFTAGEKLSNFTFTLFDLLNEQRDFVDQTYSRYVLVGFKKSTLKKDVTKLFKEFINRDERISTLNRNLFDGWFYGMVARKYLALILLWLRDESDSQEKTMALVDKLSSFLDELLYSNVLDKGFDLVQYLYTNDFFKFDIPYLSKILNNLSKEEENNE